MNLLQRQTRQQTNLRALFPIFIEKTAATQVGLEPTTSCFQGRTHNLLLSRQNTQPPAFKAEHTTSCFQGRTHNLLLSRQNTQPPAFKAEHTTSCFQGRTHNLLLSRQSLYQLSHRGSPAGWIQITQVMQGRASN